MGWLQMSNKWAPAWSLSQNFWDYWTPFLLVPLWDNVPILIIARYETRAVFTGKTLQHWAGTATEHHCLIKDKENFLVHSPSSPPDSRCVQFANITLSNVTLSQHFVLCCLLNFMQWQSLRNKVSKSWGPVPISHEMLPSLSWMF